METSVTEVQIGLDKGRADVQLLCAYYACLPSMKPAAEARPVYVTRPSRQAEIVLGLGLSHICFATAYGQVTTNDIQTYEARGSDLTLTT